MSRRGTSARAEAETPAAWVGRLAPGLRPIARRARAVIKSSWPELTEYVHSGVIKYGRTTASADWRLYLSAQRDHVNVGFVRGLGAAVPDPSGIIEGTGKVVRHVPLRTVADAERPALRAVLRAAGKVRPLRAVARPTRRR